MAGDKTKDGRNKDQASSADGVSRVVPTPESLRGRLKVAPRNGAHLFLILRNEGQKGSMGKATGKRNIAIPDAFETREIVGKRQGVRTDVGNVNDDLA